MSVVDWLFRHRETGRYTVAQVPNAALVVWMAATGARWVVDPAGTARSALSAVAAAALVVWAVGEIVRGVNPFRRLLGGVVLAGQVVALVH